MTGEFDTERRRVVIGAAFAVAAGAAWARRPSTVIDYLGKRDLETLIPNNIGPWTFQSSSGLVVPPEDQLSLAVYSQLLTRIYTNAAGEAVMLLIAQSSGQTGVLQIHRPEVCYPAGGFVLSPARTIMLNGGGVPFPAVNFTARNGPRIEQIIYWTRIGDHMPGSWLRQRRVVAEDNLLGRIPDAVLVRVSTIDADPRVALARMASFVDSMLSALPPPDRRVLVA